jgi:hypothetical protein
MSSNLKRIGQSGRVALALGAYVLLSASISGAQAAPTSDLTAQLARHYQHEDALYGMRSTSTGTRTPVDAMALHFKHEDAINGGSQEMRSARSPAQMLALHDQHEDALYRAQASASSRPRFASPAEAGASDGFDWSDALVGAGSTVALLLLSVAAIAAVRRGRSRLAHS